LTQSLTYRQHYDPNQRVIAITGVSSHIGTELIKRLEKDRRYKKILAIDICRPNIPLGKTEFHKVDLTQPTADAAVARVLSRGEADSLVHLAFLSRPTHHATWAHELEAIGTMHVLNACAACHIRKVVSWSLCALYGPSPTNPNYLEETREPECVAESRFFRDKLEAEKLALRFQKENPQSVVTILRTAPIIGPQIDNYVTRYLSLPLVPTLMGYDPLIQLLHEEDAVGAFKLAVDADFPGIFNIAGDGVLPLSTVLSMAGLLALPIPGLFTNSLAKIMWMTQLADTPPVFLDFLRYICVASTTKTKRVMGYSPRYPIAEIVAHYAGFDKRPEITLGGRS
jgi:UDP-glucose 4-epimerase